MQAYTLPDVTPDGTATQITTNPNLRAVYVTISAPKGNSDDIRYGDSSVGANQGATISPGTSQTLSRGSFDQQGYQLNTIYIYGSGSDKGAITYGQ